ncbi:unnamed protein product [Cuscuta campestris]|uniref:Uncharacterized protein n=1 Tax=Cuscuta campestris TaxID=132261 RepID=A0A484KY07_9ASTE|nr:unnamed protein product [Cuscuta campestris]
MKLERSTGWIPEVGSVHLRLDPSTRGTYEAGTVNLMLDPSIFGTHEAGMDLLRLALSLGWFLEIGTVHLKPDLSIGGTHEAGAVLYRQERSIRWISEVGTEGAHYRCLWLAEGRGSSSERLAVAVCGSPKRTTAGEDRGEDRRRGPQRGPSERTANVVACLGDLLDLVVDRRKEWIAGGDRERLARVLDRLASRKRGSPVARWCSPEKVGARRRAAAAVRCSPEEVGAHRSATAAGKARRWIDARVVVVRCLVPPEVKHARGLADLGGCSPTMVEGTAGSLVACSLLAGKIPAVLHGPMSQI